MGLFGFHKKKDECSEVYDPDEESEDGKVEVVDDLERHIFDPSYEDVYDEKGNVATVTCDNFGESECCLRQLLSRMHDLPIWVYCRRLSLKK